MLQRYARTLVPVLLVAAMVVPAARLTLAAGPGITIVETGGSTAVSESGSTDTFTVALASQPTANVVLTVSASDATEASVSPTTLTFSTSNWSTPQTVIVTGLADGVADGNQTSTVTVAVSGSSASEYLSVASPSITVTTTDINGGSSAAGLTLNKSALTVSEAGGSDSFTVMLNSQPTAGVTVSVASGDTTEATVSPATLTFTTANWNAPQTVTVTGVADGIADGNQTSTITLSVTAGSAAEYVALASRTVSVTTTDVNGGAGTAGITLSKTSATVSESGTTDSFTVVLNSMPTAGVTLGVASSDTGEVTVSPATLSFTTANWNTPQTVTLTGVSDGTADGNQTSTVTISVNSGSASEYTGVASKTVSVTTTDTNTGGTPGINLSKTAATVSESGTTDSFTVWLNSMPTANVTLGAASSDTGEAAVSPSSLTFTSANWNTAQTVTVTGVSDGIADGNQTSTITISVSGGSAAEYGSVASRTVSVTTTDVNSGTGTAGITLSKTAVTVSESGTTDAFTVRLNSIPTANVTIGIVANDTGEATASPASLTFTSGNWSTPQTVTVTGVADGIADGNQTSAITVSVNAGSASEYLSVGSQTVTVTTTDVNTGGAGSASISPDQALTETNLNGRTLTLTLSGTTFADSSLASGNFTLNGAPPGTSISSVTWNSTSQATLTLAFNGSDFDGDFAMSVTVAATELTGGTSLTTNTIPVHGIVEETGGGGNGGEGGDHEGGARPGWGCGDQNHEHSGPPGEGSKNGSPCDKHEDSGSAQAQTNTRASEETHDQGSDHGGKGRDDKQENKANQPGSHGNGQGNGNPGNGHGNGNQGNGHGNGQGNGNPGGNHGNTDGNGKGGHPGKGKGR